MCTRPSFYKRIIVACTMTLFIYSFPYTLRQNSKISGAKARHSPLKRPWNPDRFCPNVSKNSAYFLRGKIDSQLMNLTEDEVRNQTIALQRMNIYQKGGAWSPDWCKSRDRVGIIIPYRDREDHLLRLLVYLSPILQRQLLDYRFIVAEQQGDQQFNKGRIMNSAFSVAEKMSLDCVIFHDVDLLPQDDRIPYGCPSQPLHLGGRVNTMKYEIWYNILVGGVLAFQMDHFRLVNGYSNQYWGWGGEDDDMGNRILASKLSITRPDEWIARYTMLQHKTRNPGKNSTHEKTVLRMIKGGISRHKYDGLNTKNAWKVTKVTETPLYFHVLVDVGQMPKIWA